MSELIYVSSISMYGLRCCSRYPAVARRQPSLWYLLQRWLNDCGRYWLWLLLVISKWTSRHPS